MNATDFINKWRNSINYLNLPSVGIHVGWELISTESQVKNFSGKEAWEKIYNCTVPWFKIPQTFQKLVTSKNSDYLQIVREETTNGKIEYYRKNGLQEPYFCAFANIDGSFLLLGDGNHRFFDCIHLIHVKKYNFDEDIKRATLDIIFLPNFMDVIRPDIIWRTNLNCERLKK